MQTQESQGTMVQGLSDKKVVRKQKPDHGLQLFLLLMTVLAKSFLSLVRRHLMSFSFLTAWHNFKF